LRIGLLGVAALAAANAAAAEPLSIQRLFAVPEISAPILAPDGASYASCTGRSTMVENDTGTREDFAADPSGIVRFATSRNRDEMRFHARASAAEPWRVVARDDTHETEGALRFVGFTENPGVLYVLAKHAGRDALFALTIATGERTPPASPRSAIGRSRRSAPSESLFLRALRSLDGSTKPAALGCAAFQRSTFVGAA
jgi:hypothetical protein